MRRAREDSHTAVATRPLAHRAGFPELVERIPRGLGFWLLESTQRAEPLGRFSFAGADPYLVMAAWGRRVALWPRRRVRADLPERPALRRGDPLEWLRGLLPPRPPDGEAGAGALPFVGGVVLALGYELAEQLEPVELPGRDDLGAPDLFALFVDRLLAYDHAAERAWVCTLGFADRADRARLRAERLADRLAAGTERGENPLAEGPIARAGEAKPGAVIGRGARSAAELRAPVPPVALRDAATGISLQAFFDEAAYAKAVQELLERIAAGDVYQANLTHRLDALFEDDPWRLYTELRRRNPAPFAAYLPLPTSTSGWDVGVTVVGSSPERFLRVDREGGVEARPMKGTRPRGDEPETDRARAAALAASPKDRAENLMIVDLLRNDLGRVCAVGSVEVPELMRIEPYATVWQMVSVVTGRLGAGRTGIDLLRAAFPPGSMTGAPKLAAMRLLARLEPVRRGVYSGALGYLDVRGGADLGVVIRTALVRPGMASIHVGGGIVADSTPAGEWQESLDKARALLDAIAATRDGFG